MPGAVALSGPLPGEVVEAGEDTNLTRLYAIWTRDTPHIGTLAVGWRFDDYAGHFIPTADDRNVDTSAERFVYAYRPNPKGPFRRGIFRTKEWEAWTITAPAEDVKEAEIMVFSSQPDKIVMLGSAITRNGVTVCTAGPVPDTAHCLFDFTQR